MRNHSAALFYVLFLASVASDQLLAQDFGIVFIKSEPPGATVIIDGRDTGKKTPFQESFAAGSHTWRLEHELHHPLEGTVNVRPNVTERLELRMRPNYGSVRVESNPTAAEFILDGQVLGRTPLTRDRIKSGIHRIEIKAEMYETLSADIMVEDEQTTSLSYDLTAGFGTIGVVALPDADIWIDGVKVGTRVFTGRLPVGYHTLEIKKEGYHPERRDLNIAAETQTTERFDLRPIIGFLSIMTEPPEAEIYIGGEKLPNTSPTFDTLMAGEHDVQIRLPGYALFQKKITIRENETQPLNVKLIYGKSFTVHSNPEGAAVWLDGAEVGTTPLTTGASSGRHELRLSLQHYQDSKLDIDLTRDGQVFEVSLFQKARLVNLHSYPKSAKYYADGILLGTTPGQTLLTEGNHQLHLERKKYKALDAPVTVSDNTTDLNFLLEPLHYRTRGGAIVWSLFWPGAGQAHLRRGGATVLFGFAGYGLLAGSYIYNQKAVESYDEYLVTTDPAERQSLRDDWQQKERMSKNMLYAAGAVWAVNLIWTAAMRSEEGRYRRLRATGQYDLASGSTSAGLSWSLTKK
jgi:hypothetical protein